MCENTCETNVVNGVVVSAPAWFRQERGNKYGSVLGLKDSELADPEELEKEVLQSEWGPVLALPVQDRQNGFKPVVDESGVNWGAFGTVDFDRNRPTMDRAKYKAARIREQLKDVVIMTSIVSSRLSGRAKYLVQKYQKMGVIETKHIVNPDMRALVRLQQKAEGLRRQVRELEQDSKRRSEQRLKVWLEAL